MNLQKKKVLAAKTLGVGKERIVFNSERLNEIKESITRQDIRDLFASKAILVKEVTGRRTIVKRKTRRRHGSVKKKINDSKQKYVKLTRKLRFHVNELRTQEKISEEDYHKLRRQIRASAFRSKAHLKELITSKK